MPDKHRNGSLESEKRIVRYKDERRRQLAAQVASRLHSNSSSEDEDQSDRRSYTEYKRRRRKEKDHKSSSKNSSRNNLTSSSGELQQLSRSRGTPDPLLSSGARRSRDSPDPLRTTPPPCGDIFNQNNEISGATNVLTATSVANAKTGSDSAISAGKTSRTSSGSRSKGGSYGSMERRGSFDSRGSGETSAGWERRETLEFELYRSNSLERYRRNIDSPEHIYQVIAEPSNSSSTRSSRRKPSPNDQHSEMNSLVSIDESRDSLLDRPVSSSYSPGDRDRDGLVSPDLIKCVTPVPRRRRKGPGELSGGHQPANELPVSSFATNQMPTLSSLSNQKPVSSYATNQMPSINNLTNQMQLNSLVNQMQPTSLTNQISLEPANSNQSVTFANFGFDQQNESNSLPTTTISQHYMLSTETFANPAKSAASGSHNAFSADHVSYQLTEGIVYQQPPSGRLVAAAGRSECQPATQSANQPATQSTNQPANLDLKLAKLNYCQPNPESPGSVLSPTASTVLSASKPPIFPTPDRNASSSASVSAGLKLSLRRSMESPPGLFSRSAESRSDTEPPFVKEFAAVMRRRSGQFNPNESAPPKPLTRPHSVYRIDTQTKPREEEQEKIAAGGEKERRKSDFLARYEELTCKAAQAIKTVDRMVNLPIPLRSNTATSSTLLSPSHPLSPHLSLPSPLSPGANSLPSPLSPGVESVEFNEEEVLKTCQDFLVDYNRSKQTAINTVTNTITLPSTSLTYPPSTRTDSLVSFRDDSFSGLGSFGRGDLPVPAPRFSLHSNTDVRPVSLPCSSSLQADISDESNQQFSQTGSCNQECVTGVIPGASRVVSQLSQEDEKLLEAAQGKLFWESSNPSAEIPRSAAEISAAETASLRTAAEITPPLRVRSSSSPPLRVRSSSFSMPDPSSSYAEANTVETTAVNLRPILKKSSEDLTAPSFLPPNSTISILKNKDDLFGVSKAKRRSTGEDGKGEHVRIRSPSPLSRNDHVRIRTPSQDSWSGGEDAPQPILRRSRDNSLGEDKSDCEIPSILKRRASSDDIGLEDYVGHSPEKTSSILKRKSSFGSTYSGTYSGIQSPEAGIHEVTRGILKKSSRNSSRTCSRSASIEDLDVEGTKSILKSRNSSRTCSRSGSQDELDLELEDDEEEWMQPKPKSILKKKQGSTDDELDDRPKSILKSRRSEESLSPSLKSRRSEGSLSPDQNADYEFPRSARNYTRHSSLPSDPEDVRSGRSSPLVKFPDDENFIRPILKNRDDSRPTTGILKRREKSSSPISATKLRRPSPTFIASKSYSPDHHFYPVEAPEQINRRLPSPLERTGVGFECQPQPSPPPLPSNSPPPASFERTQNAGRSISPTQRSTQPVSPQQMGTRTDSPQPRGLRLMSPPLPSRRSSSPPLRGWRHISPPGASSWRRTSPPAVPGWRQTSPLGQLSYRLSSPPDSSSWRQSSPSEHARWRQSSPGQAGWRPLSSSTGAMAQLMRGQGELEDMEDEILQIVEQQDLIEGNSDPVKLSLVDQVNNSDFSSSIGQNIGRPPKSGGVLGPLATANSSQQPTSGSTNVNRRRRKHSNSRFQTQPITVDEVEKARRGFLDPCSGNSPIPGIRCSPLYSMLRPLSLEELGGEVKSSGVSVSLSATRTNYSSTSSSMPSEPVITGSASVNKSTNQRSTSNSSQYKWSDNLLHTFRQNSQSSCDSSASPKSMNQVGAALHLPSQSALSASEYSSPAMFRPVRSPLPVAHAEQHEPTILPPAQFSRTLSSPPLNREGRLKTSSHRNFQYQSRSLSSPAVDRSSFTSSPVHFQYQHNYQAGSTSFRRPLSSPPLKQQYSTSYSRQYSPPDIHQFQQQHRTSSGSPPPPMRPSSLAATSSPPPLARPSAFRPVPTRVQSACSGGELTPITGPIPLYRETSLDKALSSGDELIPGILKNRESSFETRGMQSLQKVPRKSILKNDPGGYEETLQLFRRSVQALPARGVLKKDPSYDGATNSRVRGSRESASSGSSSDDVGRTFSDVVIDPIPGQGRRSAPETPLKRGAGTRTPVIPPSSVKISADGDLAGKLAKLSTQADVIKHKMNSEERQDYHPESHSQNKTKRRASINSTKYSFY